MKTFIGCYLKAATKSKASNSLHSSRFLIPMSLKMISQKYTFASNLVFITTFIQSKVQFGNNLLTSLGFTDRENAKGKHPVLYKKGVCILISILKVLKA